MSLPILKLILDDRTQASFADSLKIPRAVMSEFMRLGKYPADKHLRKLMKVENVSMSALWGASSAPFMLQRTISTLETNEILNSHLSDHNWDVHLISGDEFLVIVLSTPASDLIDGEVFNYTSVEVICGPTDHVTANIFRNVKVKHIHLPIEDAHAVATGYKSTYYLFGKNTLANAKEIAYSEMAEMFSAKIEKSALVLKKIMKLLDDVITQQKADITAEERRKLVSELYIYAVKEGLVEEDVSENLVQSMLRVI